jgi:dihydroorotate dehydrogenase electron transfer subunit
MKSSKQEDNSIDFRTLSRSHLYWGRKHTQGLGRVLKHLGPKDIFLDPFCGGGTPIITALSRGARVIGSELNPMAVFITKVLIQPISVFAIKEAFEAVRDDVADRILEHYAIACPKCRKTIYFDYIKWDIQNGEDSPRSVKTHCQYCGLNELRPLSDEEIKTQLQLSAIQPEFWFPQNPIRSQRKTKVKFFHELFTGRNLTSLAILHHAIENVSSIRCRETLHFVFTGMLYSCSSMQTFSDIHPSSSRGWTAPRFYFPAAGKEKNVWKAFEKRFETVLDCKNKTNAFLGSVKISNSMEEFENSDDRAYLYEADHSGFSFPRGLEITHVFLDPPYNDDVDYVGLSEFWGCWLRMASDIQNAWHPGTISEKENAERLVQLLLRIRDNTTPSCFITLAYGAKKNSARELMRESVSEAGYRIMEDAPILYNTSRKRGRIPPPDRYLLLQRESKQTKATDEIALKDSNELKFFIRVVAFLLPDISHPERIVEKAVNLVAPPIRLSLREVKDSEVVVWISNKELNRKAYNRLSLDLVGFILSQDGYRLASADMNQFDDSHLHGYGKIDPLTKPPKGVDFVFEDDKGRNILFCFYDERKVEALSRISKDVLDKDGDAFQKLCYLIIPTQEVMMKCREVNWADKWPRGFFVDFDGLLRKAGEIGQTRYDHMSAISPECGHGFRSRAKIDHFIAEVSENIPVGENRDPKHFIIRFKAPELKYVVPGQFVMVDTLPHVIRKKIYGRRSVLSSVTSADHSYHAGMIDLARVSFLKRPFSIHRAFYKNFKLNSLKNMSLPHTLATVTRTVFPDEFEIFCKRIENGTGTNELRQMGAGSIFRVLGPLGRAINLSEWGSDGIKEVHLIGGGVGMAPLMFFGQALKYYSFRIKAFIGVDRFDTLLYRTRFPMGFAEDPEKAYVYIDNLLQIGLSQGDIHISTEEKKSANEVLSGLSGINYYNGLVSRQYELYIEKLHSTENILALACGPEPMLKALKKITSKFRTPMKVLMEKRMGCGIGVCMSCVCRTIKSSQAQYSRVCVDGPIFDSEDIVWE